MSELMNEWGWVIVAALGVWALIKMVRGMSKDSQLEAKDEIASAILGEVKKYYGPAKAASIASTVLASAKEGNLGGAAKKLGIKMADKLASKLEEDTGIDYSEIRVAAGEHPLRAAAKAAAAKEAANATKRKKIAKGAKVVLNIAKNFLV